MRARPILLLAAAISAPLSKTRRPYLRYLNGAPVMVPLALDLATDWDIVLHQQKYVKDKDLEDQLSYNY